MEEEEELDVDVMAVFDDGMYRVEMWESFPFFPWRILCDGVVVQEGGSISENAGRIDSQKLLHVIMRKGGSGSGVSGLGVP